MASFFLSRIDTKADALLDPGSPARGQVAIASARVAYQRYRAKFAGPAGSGSVSRGARRQRPLWASTGTKNPAYSDVLYVAELIGPDVISTMPEQTLRAFADHGAVARTVDADPDDAERMLAAAAAGGLDLAAVTAQLEREGVSSFCDSYHQLLACIEHKLTAVERAAVTLSPWPQCPGNAQPARRPGAGRQRQAPGPVTSRRAVNLHACGCLAVDEPQRRKNIRCISWRGQARAGGCCRRPLLAARWFEPWHRSGHIRAADTADRDHRDPMCAADPDNHGR